MAFCDLFKEFQPIRVDEDIYLRQTDPKKDARPFWEIYYDEENFKYFGLYKRPGEWNEERELRVQESRLKGRGSVKCIFAHRNKHSKQKCGKERFYSCMG